jgi:hypothetical protein
LHLKRSDIDATVEYANKSRPALIEERWRGEVGVAHVDGRAARQQGVGQCRSTIVLQGAQHRVGIDLVAWAVQKTAAIIATDVVAMSDKAATIIKNVGTRDACF